MPARSTSRRSDRPVHRCTECGATSAKWVGRCPECQAWGTLTETASGSAPPRVTVLPSAVRTPARPITEVDAEEARARPTGVGEFDRVLGGGLVPGAVVLLAGEPGCGKSTLSLAAAAQVAARGARVLYVTGEESAAQVRLRAGRTCTLVPTLYLAAETDLGAVLTHIDEVKPGLLIVDSVQTIASGEIEGGAGGVPQVRAVTAALTGVAKERGIATLLIGHVTKDGNVAGPRLLEHLVDVVLHFEGERHSPLRVLRAAKNRFGAVDEVGCFTMHDSGIEGVPDPSGLFLSDRRDNVPGTCVTVTVEGRRPLPAEVQVLFTKREGGTQRRSVSGLDASRLALVLAVVDQTARQFARLDVFAATVGGIRLAEPAADLALALAMSSAFTQTPLPAKLVAIGEVGLSQELRAVPALDRRLAEAARLGFSTAIVPRCGVTPPPGMHVLEAAYLHEAFEFVEMLHAEPVQSTTAHAGVPQRVLRASPALALTTAGGADTET